MNRARPAVPYNRPMNAPLARPLAPRPAPPPRCPHRRNRSRAGAASAVGRSRSRHGARRTCRWRTASARSARTSSPGSSPRRSRIPTWWRRRAPACGAGGRGSGQPAGAGAVAALAGNALLPQSRPLAAVYAGHQFGVWAGRLGDGRALLLGDAAATGVRRLPRPRRFGPAPAGLRALGTAAQGLRHDALLAHGRRPRRAALVDPRVPLLGGDGGARHSDHARAWRWSARTCRCSARTSRPPRWCLRMSPSFVRFGSFEYFYYFRKHDAAARCWPTM